MRISMKVINSKKVIQKLNGMEPKVRKKIERSALRKGGQIIAVAAKSRAPVYTGKVKKRIKVRAGKRRKNRLSVVIGTSQKDFTGDQFYAGFVEFGTKERIHKSGKRVGKVPATHFFEEAVKATSSQVAGVIREEIESLIRAEWK